MNNISDTTQREDIILTPEQFAPIFASAYAVAINGCLYDKVDDYEREDGEYCTIFQNEDEIIDIDYEKVEKVCPVKFNCITAEYEFIGEVAEHLPAFQILAIVKPQ